VSAELNLAPVTHYVIQDQLSGAFMCSRHAQFTTVFEVAIANGLMFNQLSSAEKRIRDLNRSLSGGNGLAPTRFTIDDEHFCSDEAYAQELSQLFDIKHRQLQLRAVPVTISINLPA
jgi:hypothetical protein